MGLAKFSYVAILSPNDLLELSFRVAQVIPKPARIWFDYFPYPQTLETTAVAQERTIV
jgi:hypothetical protein